MTEFQDKTIKFIGKSENPAAVEVLSQLLSHTDPSFRELAFNAIYLKKAPELLVLLFTHFQKDEDFWGKPGRLPSDRLAKIADAALRDTSGQYRQSAAEIAMKYKLHEVLPTVLLFLESTDEQLVVLMRKTLLHLADSLYNDVVSAPVEERRNFDRKREWFVLQLDASVKRYSVSEIDEVLQSLLIVTKKEFDTMKLIAADHRSSAAKKIRELLQTGTHRSYLRILLSYLDDLESPAIMDEIIAERSDELFVRKLLEVIGRDPSPEFRTALKRFQSIAWLDASNPKLPALVEVLETNAVQLLQSVSFPKERTIALYRFFLERPSVESRRAAATAVRWLVGAELNHMLLQYVDNSDPQTAAILFKLLKTRGVAGLDAVIPKLIERPDQTIRQAIYEMMPELHVETLASRINQMTPMAAQTMGRHIRLIDPNVHKMLDDDIKSPIPIRRASACKVAMVTGYGKEFAQRIIEMAECDDETQVRLAAIAALSTILLKEALTTLKNLMGDRSTDIREAVDIAIKDWAAAYHAAMGEQQT